MLAEMAGQVEQRGAELGQAPGSLVGVGEARFGQERRQRLVVGNDEPGQKFAHASKLFLGKAERATAVPHRHARAIGDHIGGHRGPMGAVLSVDVLDDLLALITRRQIEIDVGHAVRDAAGALHPLFG